MSKFCWTLLGLIFIKLLFRMRLLNRSVLILLYRMLMLFLHLLVRFCFKKHHRVSLIKWLMLETSPYAVTPSTKLPLSSILSPPSSSLSSLSSSSISASPSSSLSSSPLSLNPQSSTSCSVLLYISLTSEVRVSPSYLNSSVFFLTTCFLLFTGFRCYVLLSNIYIDLLLLA